jgi:hypothetical protein
VERLALDITCIVNKNACGELTEPAILIVVPLTSTGRFTVRILLGGTKTSLTNPLSLRQVHGQVFGRNT